MSDSEIESRSQAVGRKRKAPEQNGVQNGNKHPRLDSPSASRSSSRESGEISSTEGGVSVRSRHGNDSAASSRASSSASEQSRDSGEISSDDEDDEQSGDEFDDEDAEDSSDDEESSDGTKADTMPYNLTMKGCRVYVGNLAYSATEEDVMDFFQDFHPLQAETPKNLRTKRPSGYAFVDFVTPEDAQAAIATLDGRHHKDRKLSIQIAKEPDEAVSRTGSVKGLASSTSKSSSAKLPASAPQQLLKTPAPAPGSDAMAAVGKPGSTFASHHPEGKRASSPAQLIPETPASLRLNDVPSHGFVVLDDLEPKARMDQYRYFHLSSGDEPAICLCCGARGHTYNLCPERTCTHCRARDSHASRNCPKWRKCTRCRQRGHHARQCRNQTFYGRDLCDVCGMSGHVEEECTRLWGAAPRAPGNGRPVAKNCYRCGASGERAHWGDDCQYRDKGRVSDSARNLIMLWSELRRQEGNGGLDYGSDGGGAGRSAPSRDWQMSMFDNGRD